MLALAAQKFGCRPSEMVVIRDPVLALDFDLAATARLLEAEGKALAGDGREVGELQRTAPMAREFDW